jgi:transposase
MEQGTTFVGMDAHKSSINVAVLYAGREQPEECQVVNEEAAVRRLVKKIVRQAPGEVRFCYEAGPCGYALQRHIEAIEKVVCVVVAPSLIPRKPGEHIKTDQRDARKLAELYRAGLLTEVCAPTTVDEALRDLVRAREDTRQDLQRARQRVSKLLLRRALASPYRAWSKPYRRWLRSLKFEHATDQAALNDYLLAVDQIEERQRGLDARLEEVAQQAPYAEPVGHLRCFRGIDTLTAVSLVAELHSFMRFRSPRELMAYLGLVPSEYSSGSSSRRGRITKAGNRHARRLLVEAAWHYRHRPGLTKVAKRRKGQPTDIIALADRAQSRLNRRYRKLNARGLPAGKVVVAVARELAGFVWAALQPAA